MTKINKDAAHQLSLQLGEADQISRLNSGLSRHETNVRTFVDASTQAIRREAREHVIRSGIFSLSSGSTNKR